MAMGCIWVVSMAMGVPHNGWFTRENAIKMDDLVVPLFMETTIVLLLLLAMI